MTGTAGVGGRFANTVNELQTRFVAVVGNVVVVIELVTRESGLSLGLQCLDVQLQLTRRGVAAALLDGVANRQLRMRVCTHAR